MRRLIPRDSPWVCGNTEDTVYPHLIVQFPNDTRVRAGDVAIHCKRANRIIYLSVQVRDTLADFVHIHSLNEDELQGYLGRKVALLDAVEVYRALHDLRRLIPVPILVLHTRHWALAYGPKAACYAISLKAGISMASTRLRLGDDYTRANVLATERMAVDNESANFAAALSELAGDSVCCLPSIQIDPGTATTVGLGDSFVGGFLPTLLES